MLAWFARPASSATCSSWTTSVPIHYDLEHCRVRWYTDICNRGGNLDAIECGLALSVPLGQDSTKRFSVVSICGSIGVEMIKQEWNL
jgi:hypothetical protein